MKTITTPTSLRHAALSVLACGALTAALLTSCTNDDLTATPGENFPEDGRVRISTTLAAPGTTTVLTRADNDGTPATTPYTGTTLGLYVDYGYQTIDQGGYNAYNEDAYNRFNLKYTQGIDGNGIPDGTWTQDLTAPDYEDLAAGRTSTTPALWKNTTTATTKVYAYGPYVKDANPGGTLGGNDAMKKRYVRFPIPRNQTGDIEAADLVWGSKTDFNPYNDLNKSQAVSIELKHCLTKFTVAIILGTSLDASDFEAASMTMHSAYEVADLYMESGNVAVSGSNDGSDLQMHPTTVTDGTGTTAANRPAFEAICLLGEFGAVGNKWLTLTLNNGKSYIYKVSAELSEKLKALNIAKNLYGHAFRLNLKVGKDKLEISNDATNGVTVVPWDSADGEITGGEAAPVWDINNHVYFDGSDGLTEEQINTCISERVQNGKLTLIGSFGDDPQAAQSNFAGLARYIRENTDGSLGNIVTELDFSGTTGVTTIGNYRYGEGANDYHNCCLNDSKLVSVKLPASVTTLNGFSGCTALTTVTAATGGDAITVGNGAFTGCTALTILPANLRTVGNMAFYRCALTEYSSTTTTKLGYQAFGCCIALTKVDCPNVTSLGYEIFAWCTNLTDIYLTAETFSYVRSYRPTTLHYDPFMGINRGSVTLHLNASQVGNIAQNTTSDKWEWTPVAVKTEGNDTGLQEPVDLSGFKAVYCGETKMYSAD